MASVEGLRRTGQYIQDVASRSLVFGFIEGYGQGNRIREQIGEPKTLLIEEVFGVVFSALMPGALVSSKLDSSSKPQTKLSELTRVVKSGVKLLSALSIDLAPLVAPIVLATNTQNSLFLLGILGKPLCNAAVWVTSDMADAAEFRKKDLPKATPGTYDFLQKAYDASYDPRLKIGVIKDIQGQVLGAIRKEKVCVESGGSCMVLYVPIIEGEKRHVGHAHVTEKDIVADIGVLMGGQSNQNIPTSIGELMEDVRKSLSHKESAAHL